MNRETFISSAAPAPALQTPTPMNIPSALSLILLLSPIAQLAISTPALGASIGAKDLAPEQALLCSGMRNNFGRPAPIIEIRRSGQGYILTFTDASGNSTSSFAIESDQVVLAANEHSGFDLEVKGNPRGPNRSKKFLSLHLNRPINFKDRSSAQQVPSTLEASTLEARAFISMDYVAPATAWAGQYSGTDACRLNLAETRQN